MTRRPPPGGIAGELFGEDFESNAPVELCIVSQIHFTHPTGTDPVDDAVMSDDGVGRYTFAQFILRCPFRKPCLVEIISVRFSPHTRVLKRASALKILSWRHNNRICIQGIVS